MRSGDFDEVAFFGAIHESGARALLIGRRALVLLGLPVLTADYDFWIAIDDIALFNAAAARSHLHPTGLRAATRPRSSGWHTSAGRTRDGSARSERAPVRDRTWRRCPG